MRQPSAADPVRHDLTDQPVLVTGASGFLGTHLVRQLVARGYRVRALVYEPDRAAYVESLGATVVHGGLEPALLREASAGCGGVFHLAAVVSFERRDAARCHAVNVEGTRHVFEAARAAGVRRAVHTASSMCIGAYRDRRVLDESSPYPLGSVLFPYVRSKKAGERVALSHADDMDVMICCPGGLLGPDDPFGSEANSVFERYFANGLRILVDHENTFVDVRDAAAGHIAAFERGRSGERYILGGHMCHLYELSRRIDRTAGGRYPPLGVLPHWVLTLAGHVLDRVHPDPPVTRAMARYLRLQVCVSSRKAREELGFHPRPLDETIADTLDWMRGRGDGDQSEAARLAARR